MKKIAIPIVLFISLIGGFAYADENQSKTTISTENTEITVDSTSRSELSKSKNSEQDTVSTTTTTTESTTESTSTSTVETQNARKLVEEKAPIIEKQAHIRNIGWMSITNDDNAYIGTVGRNLPLEAFKLKVQSDYTGDVKYSAHVRNIGWQNFVQSGQVAGTTGRALSIEALKIQLTGQLAEHYDIYYRVHVQNFGWLDWAKNGEEAGSQGFAYHAEAVDVKLVKKGQTAPGNTTNPFKLNLSLTYNAHVSNIGWMSSLKNGSIAGTTGRNLPLEALQLHLSTNSLGNVLARAHVRSIGWQNWTESGKQIGTTGRALPIEAVQFKLTNSLEKKFDIYYRAHIQNVGWLGWAKNGEIAGSTGMGYHLEAIEIKMISKDSPAPSQGTRTFVSQSSIKSQAVVSQLGVLNWVGNNQIIGTVGKNLPLLGFKTVVENNGFNGGINYSVSENGKDWHSAVSNGALSNNSTIQIVKLNLTGEVSKYFDVYYRAHVQNIGWLSWAKNGEFAGTSNYNYHIEAIQVAIQRKNLGFAGYTGQGNFIDKNSRRLVFLDPGHGGYDPGATSYTGLREKDVTLSISKMVRDKLLQYGNKYDVIMSRTDDRYVDFKTERSEMSNRANADIFVSVHVNSGGGGSAKGVEVYWYEYDSAYQPVVNQKYHNDPIRLRNSERLANSIQNNIIKSTGAVNRGVRRATYAVVREAKAPAVLIETGYIDNSSEVYKLASKQYQEKIANGIVNGIIEYFNK